jgi:hypothetical protein
MLNYSINAFSGFHCIKIIGIGWRVGYKDSSPAQGMWKAEITNKTKLKPCNMKHKWLLVSELNYTGN